MMARTGPAPNAGATQEISEFPAPIEFIGDILLAFGEPTAPLPYRFQGAGWGSAARNPNWKLQTCPTSPGWKGYPWEQRQSGGWQMWVLGAPSNENGASLDSGQLSRGSQSLHEAISDWNGQFLACAWHDESRYLHVWTDRFATLHTYYAWDGRRAAIGTFSPAVAAVASGRQLDWQGLAGFFGFGFFPQARTHLQGVKILRPASHYTFDQDGRQLREERYWRWWHEPDERRTYYESVEAFAGLFQRVIGEGTREGRVAVPVSGGLDSRATVAALTQPGMAPDGRLWAYSYGYAEDSVETRIARQVAAARGLPFEAFTIHPYLFDEIERLLAWTEGFTDITQARQAFMRERIAEKADVLVAALWGDVWLDDMGLVGAAEGTIDEDTVLYHARKKMQKGGRGWLLEHIVAPQLVGSDLDELLTDVVRSELAPLNHIQDPDFRLKAFKTEQWSFRWSLAPMRVFQSAAWPYLVFYDTRLADFFCTLPSDYVSGRRLQIDYLKRCAPDLARIAWEVYDADLFTYQYHNSLLLPKRALKKAWRRLARKKIVERNWEVQLLHEGSRRGLERWLLQPGLALHEFVLPSDVRALLEAFYAAPLEDGRGYTVSMLLTFSAWLELFG